MTPRKRTKPLRDGPGRPPIDPNYDTVLLGPIRISRILSNRIEAARIRSNVAEQLDETTSDVVRRLLEDSLKRMEKKK